MANTEALLALQTEYPTAFADPEAVPPELTEGELGDAIATTDEECRTGETEQREELSNPRLKARGIQHS